MSEASIVPNPILNVPDSIVSSMVILSPAIKFFTLKEDIALDIAVLTFSTSTLDSRTPSFVVFSATVPETALEDAKAVIEENAERWGVAQVDYNENLAKVSVVGAGMTSNAGVAAKMFEAMFDSNINIHMISTSEIKISILIDKKDMHKAMNAIHDIFNLAVWLFFYDATID